MMHECIVGMLYNYEATDIVTLSELKEHIQRNKRLPSYFHKKPYELADYCDKRKSTDLSRFEFCPLCGKEIDWKALKGGVE